MRALVRRAHVITPNLTEAMLLLIGKEETEKQWKALQEEGDKAFLRAAETYGMRLLKEYNLQTVVITGVEHTEEKTAYMGNLVCEAEENFWVFSKKEGGSYSGTGDLFASILSAGLVKGLSMKECAEKAARFLEKALCQTVKEGTDRNEGVCFEPYLKELL